MNGRIQRWQLALRLIVALLAGGALLSAAAPAWGWPPAALAALLLGLLLFWSYALPMGLLFASLRLINRGAAPGWAQLLRAWIGEFIVAEQVFAWQQPFHEQREPDFLPAGVRRRGVLLLHGFSCNRGMWNVWMRRLRAAGHPHVALSLEPIHGDIDGYVEQIEAALRRLEQAGAGLPPLIVAHSMGGLSARAWWRRHGRSGRLQRLITLGTPHAGTLMAQFSPALNVRQMRRGSAWLRALAQAEGDELRGLTDCYLSACDQIVCPVDTAALPGARRIELSATGHLAMVFHPQVFAAVTAYLDEGPGPAG